MRYLYLTITILLFVHRGMAQNLVPNESFETYSNCPANTGSVVWSSAYTSFPFIENWTNPLKLCSPDYFNSCATQASGLKVPNTSFGYQQARTGNAQAGIIAWQAFYSGGNFAYDYREYVQNKLSQPLKTGRQYCVRFYVSPTVSAAFNFNYVAIDELGINFSKNRTIDSLNYNLALPYHVSNKPGSFLTDTSKWYEITGIYTATGGEEWITIGCFNTAGTAPAFVNLYPVVPNINILYWSYLFIDDVIVTEINSADTVIKVHDTVVCKTAVSIPLSVPPGALSYKWNTGDTNTQYLATDTGTYWCVSNVECGLRTDTFHIRYRPFAKLDLGNDKVDCNLKPVTITAPSNYKSYLWSNGTTAASITVAQPGTYILTVTDSCGTQSDTIEVFIQPPTPSPQVSDTTICQYTIGPRITVAGTGLTWYTIPNATVGSHLQPEIITSVVGNQTLYVSQTIGKCESPAVPVTVTIRYKPQAEIGNFISICAGKDTVIGQPHDDVFYLWNTGEQICCITPHTQGTYELMLSNDCGVSFDTAFVEISACDDCLFTPNAFTPNKDGRNDLFTPVIKCPVADYSLKVYNRWGAVVFSSQELSDGWNGKYRDMNADAGVYVFLIEYRSLVTGSRKLLKGNLTLIR